MNAAAETPLSWILERLRGVFQGPRPEQATDKFEDLLSALDADLGNWDDAEPCYQGLDDLTPGQWEVLVERFNAKEKP